MVSCLSLGGNYQAPWLRSVPALQRSKFTRAGDAGVGVCLASVLSGGYVGMCLPFGERIVDIRYHLGTVDFADRSGTRLEALHGRRLWTRRLRRQCLVGGCFPQSPNYG